MLWLFSQIVVNSETLLIYVHSLVKSGNLNVPNEIKVIKWSA